MQSAANFSPFAVKQILGKVQSALWNTRTNQSISTNIHEHQFTVRYPGSFLWMCCFLSNSMLSTTMSNQPNSDLEAYTNVMSSITISNQPNNDLESEMARIRCMGFYPSQPIWVDTKPPFHTSEELPQCWRAIAMHQLKRSYDHDDYILCIARDGLITITLKQKVFDEENIPASNDFSSIRRDPFYGCLSTTRSGRKWSLYLSYINAIHLLLTAARYKVRKPSPRLPHVREISMRQVFVFSSLVSSPVLDFPYGIYDFSWDNNNGTTTVNNKMFDTSMIYPRDGDCQVLPISVFDDLNAQLSICDSSRIKLLAMLSQGVHHFQEASCNVSLMLFWCVVENFVSHRFNQNNPQASSKTPTANKMIDELKKQNLLPRSCYKRTNTFGIVADIIDPIDEIREARNDFVHKTTSCTDGQCQKAYMIITDLVKEDWTIHLPCLDSMPLQCI